MFRGAVHEDYILMQQVSEKQNWQELGELAHRMAGVALIGKEAGFTKVFLELEQPCLSRPPHVRACHTGWEVAKRAIIKWLDAAESID